MLDCSHAIAKHVHLSDIWIFELILRKKMTNKRKLPAKAGRRGSQSKKRRKKSNG